MKFLECANLSYMSSLMDGVDVGDCIFYANMEAYSCKSVKLDRKLSNLIERRIAEEDQILRVCSPAILPAESPPDYPMGLSLSSSSMMDPSPAGSKNTQLHVYTTLVLCLNHCYNNEFDFSSVPAEQFRQEESLSSVKTKIHTLLSRVNSVDIHFFDDFWQTIGEVVNLTDCDFYTYDPVEGEDPVEELEKNTLWSKHFFFYAKKQKRILLFRCWAKSKWICGAPEDNDDDYFEEPNNKNLDVHFGSSSSSSISTNSCAGPIDSHNSGSTNDAMDYSSSMAIPNLLELCKDLGPAISDETFADDI